MKKILITLLITLLILPTIFALNLEINKKSSQEVMITSLNEAAVFDLEITNRGSPENVEFYNLLGFDMFPVGTVPIGAGETIDVELRILPIGDFDHRGFYTLSYFIRGTDGSEQREELTFNVVELKDVFEIGSGDFDPESNSVEIYIHNKVNFDFRKINAKFTSAFFNIEEEFPLGPNEKKTISVKLNKEDFKQLVAGFYTLESEISVQDEKAEIEGTLNFKEKNIIATQERTYGFFITTKIIKKTNDGNVPASSDTIIKKNIISRLFTNFSPEPDIIEREGLTTYYTWNKKINPGETLEIVVKTNWLFPLLLILFVIVVVILAKQYSKTDLVLKKKVTFVRAKGGEFALKVSIFAHSKKYIERVNLIDRLPPLVKLYERFGGEKPTRVNEAARKMEWYFEKLEAGEMRTISYLIYSKIGVMGKFALPTATAIYEKEGKIKEVESNRTFFVAEQRKGDIEEE